MISNLSHRDRIALVIGGVVILVTFIFLGIVEPYRNALDRLDNQIASRQRQVKEVLVLKQEYQRLEKQLGEVQKRLRRGDDFSLFSFVEALVADVAGKERLVYMRPQTPSVQEGFKEESVEIKLDRISLEQMVRLLHQIDSAEAYLQVKNLRFKTRFDDRSRFEAVLTISSFGRSA